MNKLDTRPWNLGLPLLVLAACGRTLPLLPSAETDSDTSDPTETDTNDPTTDTPQPTIDPDECQNSDDCPPGYYCGANNQCVEYYDYCSDGDCCWDGCCYDGCHYYECYSDYECGEGFECRYYACEPVEGPQPCDDVPIAFGASEIVLEYSGEISLAFVDAPGTGHELAIATGSVVQIVGAESSLVLAEDLAAEDLAVGDLEGDGDEDVVVLSSSGLHTFVAESNGSFTVGPHTDVLDTSDASLELADFDGDLEIDAFVSTPSATYLFMGVGDGTFAGGAVVAPNNCSLTSIANPQSPAFDDVFFAEGGQVWYAPANPEGVLEAYSLGGELSGGVCPLGAGDFDADGMTDVAVLDASRTGWVTTWWAVGAEQVQGTWVPPIFHTSAAIVDLNLDGREDLALTGSQYDVTIRFGTSDIGDGGPPLGCYVTVPIEAPPQSAWFGDFDGDGDRDLVGADGSYLWIANATL
jgi:hypothetical protein